MLRIRALQLSYQKLKGIPTAQDPNSFGRKVGQLRVCGQTHQQRKITPVPSLPQPFDGILAFVVFGQIGKGLATGSRVQPHQAVDAINRVPHAAILVSIGGKSG